MFDAEIAATLLNRWDRKRPCPAGQPSLELLREGKLHFRHEGGESTQMTLTQTGVFALNV
ncbi:hypothetical protein [Paraburkholderia sp. RL17-337-BIB-A]|jgi:hypothetical protein|uniref:hypothetical protein n=1 Tax=Paraburkholderia sp. RL17-337-BIB-A TaxID=3031636 RepID=UPI0038B837D6